MIMHGIKVSQPIHSGDCRAAASCQRNRIRVMRTSRVSKDEGTMEYPQGSAMKEAH